MRCEVPMGRPYLHLLHPVPARRRRGPVAEHIGFGRNSTAFKLGCAVIKSPERLKSITGRASRVPRGTSLAGGLVSRRNMFHVEQSPFQVDFHAVDVPESLSFAREIVQVFHCAVICLRRKPQFPTSVELILFQDLAGSAPLRPGAVSTASASSPQHRFLHGKPSHR